MSNYGQIDKNDCELTFTLTSCCVAHEMADAKEEDWPKIYEKLTSKLNFNMKLFKRHTWNVLKEIEGK